MQEYICTILKQDKRTRIIQRVISWVYYYVRNAMTYDNFEKECVLYILSINLVQIFT